MKKIKLSAVIILLVQILFCPFSFPATMSVYYVNVGQGDAEYVELPNGENLLIDGGPNSSTSQTNPLISFLSSKGVTKINHVFLSHAHSDHYSGLSAVFDKYTVEKYYDSFLNGSSAASTFRTKASSRITVHCYNTVNEIPNGTAFYTIDATTSAPALSIIMLHKGDAFGTSPPSANDNSLIFRIVFGSSTFIFGGDTGGGGNYKPLEDWVINNYSQDTLQSDCYKVHHHGSSTSSTEQFLAKLKPKYAFIEVGANSYGHPSIDAINRIKNAGVTRIYYTGNNPFGPVDGTIQVLTTGDGTYTITPNYIPQIAQPEQPEQPAQPEQPLNSTYIVLFNNLFHPDRQEWTELQYYISQPGEMDVKIFTLDGEMVKQYKRYDANSGTYFWAWNGKNRDDDIVAAGVYILKIKTADDETTKKAILLR